MFFQSRAKLWLFASALLALAHLAWNYGALPEKMPTHFGPDGKADGWMSKSNFALFQLGLVGFMSLLFLGLGWLFRVLPDDSFNMPNRDYWLAPARRAETVRKMSGEMAGFGAALNVFFLGVQDQNIRAAISGTNRLGPLFTVYLIGFLVYTGVWVVGLYRRWGCG